MKALPFHPLDFLASLRDERAVMESGLFDESWYRSEYPGVPRGRRSALRDFLKPEHVSSRKPCPWFDPAQYAEANADVAASGVPPALHWARDGKREGRPLSRRGITRPVFPAGAAEAEFRFRPLPGKPRRIAVFAAFSADGTVPETTIFYLKGLREIADALVFVANSPVMPGEAEKLRGLADIAVFRHHGGYDFGSWKAGLAAAGAAGRGAGEVVLCNDSCYGPVFPLSRTFAAMDARPGADFWGMTSMTLFGGPVVQSYFTVFRRRVVESGALDGWFARLETPRDRGNAVVQCEAGISRDMLAAGFEAGSFVPLSFHARRRANPTKFPLAMLRKFGMPLVKVKAWRGDTFEPRRKLEAFVRAANPALAEAVERRELQQGRQRHETRSQVLPG